MVEERLLSDNSENSELEEELLSIRDFLRGEMRRRGLHVSEATPLTGRVIKEQGYARNEKELLTKKRKVSDTQFRIYVVCSADAAILKQF